LQVHTKTFCLTGSDNLPVTAIAIVLGLLAMALSFGLWFVTVYYLFLFLNEAPYMRLKMYKKNRFD
jgi:hypothetical protein